MGPALYLLQRKDIKSSSNPNSIIYQLSPKYLVLVISQMLSHLMFNITKHGSLYHQLNFKTKGSKAWISHLRTEAGKQKGQDIPYGEPGLWFYLERGVLNIQKDKGWVYTQLAFYLGEGNGNPLQCSCLENPREGGSLVGCHLWGHTELDTTEATQLSLVHKHLNNIVLLFNISDQRNNMLICNTILRNCAQR